MGDECAHCLCTKKSVPRTAYYALDNAALNTPHTHTKPLQNPPVWWPWGKQVAHVTCWLCVWLGPGS
eukprot:6377858-Prymnesium_polylepis.1